MDPAERARLAELNRLKKRERELEERREKIEAHRHIVPDATDGNPGFENYS